MIKIFGDPDCGS